LSATKIINASVPRLRRQFAWVAELLFQRAVDRREPGVELGAELVHDSDDQAKCRLRSVRTRSPLRRIRQQGNPSTEHPFVAAARIIE
jgi:hypothetical protein